MNLPIGDHIAYIRDKNGCGVLEVPFKVFGFPKFFTPNGDGFNDVWQPKGLDNSTRLIVNIFDRYGKLLKQFNPHSSGWDGKFNGELLPNGDYWYLATENSNLDYRGHFTLKR